MELLIIILHAAKGRGGFLGSFRESYLDVLKDEPVGDLLVGFLRPGYPRHDDDIGPFLVQGLKSQQGFL
jgi:hypothetical protein